MAFRFKIQGNDFAILDNANPKEESLRENRSDLKWSKTSADVYIFRDRSDKTQKGEQAGYPFGDIIDDSTGLSFPSVDDLNDFLGFHLGSLNSLPASADYFKDEVLVTTTSNNFNSNTPTNIPGMTYTIPVGFDGDYVFYAIVSCNNDQNEELDCYFALNGGTILNSISTVTQRKNKDDSVQNTYPIDGLVAGDIVTVQFNTRNDNVDLEIRRILIQSWNLV